jgi:hypothetical protein
MDLDALRSALRREGKLVLRLRVTPKCPATGWAGAMDDGTLKLRLRAVPEDGKANQELVRFLAAEFCLPRQQIEIVSGASSRLKQVRLTL